MNSPRTMRINLLYERLKSANGIRIGDLAREFEVSTKTIARDFMELQNLGAYNAGQLLRLDKTLIKMRKNPHKMTCKAMQLSTKSC